MFTAEEQAVIDRLLAEATSVPKNGLMAEDGYYFRRRLSDDEAELFGRYVMDKHGITRPLTHFELTSDGSGQPLPRTFGKDC